MKHLASLVLIAVVLVAADKPADKKTDKERLQGTWVAAAVETDGKEMKDGPVVEALRKGKATYKGDAYTHSMAPDGYTVTFTIDAEKKPATLDLEVSFMGAKTVFRELYEFSGDDTLRICTSPKDPATRPKEFTSKEGQTIITYKREMEKPEK